MKTTEFRVHVILEGHIEHDEEDLDLHQLLKEELVTYFPDPHKGDIGISEVTFSHKSTTEDE